MTRRLTRMRGADASFLYLETPAMHMHTLKVAVIEPSPEMTFDNLVPAMLTRLRRMPALRRRVVPIPFRLNHPVLITQRRIDPDRHFFRHQVGGTGSRADLEELIGEIASTPLDRSVPLWEVHLCTGLAGGQVAVVAKIHHAVADGVAANSMLANLVDVSSADRRPVVYDDAVDDEAIPSDRHLVREALTDAFLQLALLPRLLLRTVRILASVVRFKRDNPTRTPMPIRDAPRVSFNGPLTPRRSFTTVTLRLDEFKAVRRDHPGVTLNDVVLAVVSGALRRWLALHGERPSMSLTAGVPVALDHRDAEPRLFGNNVSNLFTTLATDIDDPTQRLAMIARTTRDAKAINERLGSSAVDWSQFLPPAPTMAAVRAYSGNRAARWHPAPFSVIVSNVPGPRERVKIGGASFSDVFSVGPLVEGIGLNVTVWSYVDRMNFTLLACPDLLPDADTLASFLPEALAELRTGPGGAGHGETTSGRESA
ncbi:wax ester/triacylglycerol synthase family O-acyltransferase [Nocardioides limicola]|uniref:wax ester/triacylglycerol synthase family O-acyltransferase n=1 Tax=Nocardioides limicola TaxID=2803368 RepID=UPI00193B19DA|nr:wax ester/triacylglycerol synthase family O-acyltransferase [Nocardioides sp. DJM-14]